MMKELSLNNCRLDGRYDIQSVLGRGSYAEIYIARDILASPQSPHSTVVIKALNVFLQNDLDLDLERTLVENFQNEAIALDRVRHPNIISRLGHGTARDVRGTVFHYLVLEYLSGGDLAHLCRQKSLSIKQAINYLEQVCAGLAHAHQHNIIHRDIKPQNLLLTKDYETVKIADFGVARVTQSDSPITRVGTNIYAPPEHSPMLALETDVVTYTELTPAADIYSLAKTVYVLLTSESPRFFANQPITELPFAMRQESWAHDLLEILQKATQNNPQERHQDVYEFWKDISRLKLPQETLNGETKTQISSGPHSTPQPHIAKGYTPLAPQRPDFDTSRELKINNKQSIVDRFPLVVRIDSPTIDQLPVAQHPAVPAQPVTDLDDSSLQIPPRESKFIRRTATFLILFGIFIGILYGTHSFLQGVGLIPSISNFFSKKIGTANTDVNLRPAPTINNEPIGLVTKDSRVRIVNSQENWYEVDIIEQGRKIDTGNEVTHGWIYGKYVDLEEN